MIFLLAPAGKLVLISCVALKFVTLEVSQNYLFCFGIIWYILCCCAVKTKTKNNNKNKQTNKKTPTKNMQIISSLYFLKIIIAFPDEQNVILYK
jgi:L-asparagine transporter-like permease